jgi:hypothetical protein
LSLLAKKDCTLWNLVLGRLLSFSDGTLKLLQNFFLFILKL